MCEPVQIGFAFKISIYCLTGTSSTKLNIQLEVKTALMQNTSLISFFLSSGVRAMKYKLITVLYLCICASLVVRSEEEEEGEEGEESGSGEENESAEEVNYNVFNFFL